MKRWIASLGAGLLLLGGCTAPNATPADATTASSTTTPPSSSVTTSATQSSATESTTANTTPSDTDASSSVSSKKTTTASTTSKRKTDKTNKTTKVTTSTQTTKATQTTTVTTTKTSNTSATTTTASTTRHTTTTQTAVIPSNASYQFSVEPFADLNHGRFVGKMPRADGGVIWKYEDSGGQEEKARFVEYDANGTYVGTYSRQDGVISSGQACPDGGYLTANTTTVSRYDANGTLLWATKLLEEDRNHLFVALSEDGTVFVLYGANLASRSVHLATLDLATGAMLKTTYLYTENNSMSSHHLLIGKNGVYVVGATSHDGHNGTQTPFNTSCHTQKGKEIVIARLDTDGNLLWVKAYGSTGDDWLNDVALDAADNLYLTLAPGKADSDFHTLPAWDSFAAQALLKLSADGDRLYVTPLCTRTMAMDTISGIHVQGDRVIVTGNAYATDPFLKDIPCEGASGVNLEDGFYITAYAHYIDANGTIVESLAFLTDTECQPSLSHLFANGTLTFAGKVCSVYNFFDVAIRNEDHAFPLLSHWKKK